MTNEDIIKGLTRMRKIFDSNSVYGSYCIDCLDAAIEALKEQPKHDQNTPQKQPDLDTLGIKTGETCEDVIRRQDAIDAMTNTLWHYPNECYRNLNVYEFAKGLAELGLKSVPSAQSKQLKVLADVLDGCPLTQPCDKMWRGGWCEEHCKNNKLQEPDAECWLKYAEVMASEQKDNSEVES